MGSYVPAEGPSSTGPPTALGAGSTGGQSWGPQSSAVPQGFPAPLGQPVPDRPPAVPVDPQGWTCKGHAGPAGPPGPPQQPYAGPAGPPGPPEEPVPPASWIRQPPPAPPVHHTQGGWRHGEEPPEIPERVREWTRRVDPGPQEWFGTDLENPDELRQTTWEQSLEPVPPRPQCAAGTPTRPLERWQTSYGADRLRDLPRENNQRGPEHLMAALGGREKALQLTRHIREKYWDNRDIMDRVHQFNELLGVWTEPGRRPPLWLNVSSGQDGSQWVPTLRNLDVTGDALNALGSLSRQGDYGIYECNRAIHRCFNYDDQQ